jgi:hypothetical protein
MGNNPSKPLKIHQKPSKIIRIHQKSIRNIKKNVKIHQKQSKTHQKPSKIIKIHQKPRFCPMVFGFPTLGDVGWRVCSVRAKLPVTRAGSIWVTFGEKSWRWKSPP